MTKNQMQNRMDALEWAWKRAVEETNMWVKRATEAEKQLNEMDRALNILSLRGNIPSCGSDKDKEEREN